ncbi:MAG: DegV family protein [Christensenellales bacterium]|jgi:DegV family protein with EDD domain
MRDFVIATDSDTEIPYTFADKYEIPVFLMPYTVDGNERLFDLGRNTDITGFYKELSDGADAITSTRPPSDIADFFRDIIKDGKEVLYLSFSSALSGHFDLSQMAKKMVLEEYPSARIEIVDTLRISMGAGQLVMYAQQLKEGGKSLDEIKDWVIQNRNRSHAWFSVDDLNYLKKGGRLSGTAAAIGTILDVKPILKINQEGKIVAADKVKGSKKILKFFLDVVQQNVENPKEQTSYVLHANNMEAAVKLKELLEENIPFREILIQDVGPVIGCHTGPGVLSVIFMGKEII